MIHTPVRLRVLLPMIAAACCIVLSPLAAAGQDPQRPAQPTNGKSTAVVQQIENGPAFGAEFKFTQVAHHDAFLLGGYGGALLDNAVFIGGAGYWQVSDDDHVGGLGYGGLLVEWYALRSPAIALSVRGLLGGGVADFDEAGYPDVHEPQVGKGSGKPPAWRYQDDCVDDQGYFIAEPQVNVTVRLGRQVAIVGGVGYRLIAAANGFEHQIQGLSGSFALQFGGAR